MTDQLWHFVWWGKRHLPQSVIQKMKKNMRKVPVIQEKSDKYHETEEEAAERFINEQLENEQTENEKQIKIKKEMENKKSLLEKTITWIKKIFNS